MMDSDGLSVNAGEGASKGAGGEVSAGAGPVVSCVSGEPRRLTMMDFSELAMVKDEDLMKAAAQV